LPFIASQGLFSMTGRSMPFPLDRSSGVTTLSHSL
jgi:hypothetical protein